MAQIVISVDVAIGNDIKAKVTFHGVRDGQGADITPRCQGSCRLSEMESGVGWGRKVDYRDETLLSRT